MKEAPVTRADFIDRFTRDGGLTYVQAATIYDCMLHVFEDGISSGSKITVGEIFSLVPVWREPRTVHMGFSKEKDGSIKRSKKVYCIGRRLRYKMNLFNSFMQNKDIKW